jgi:DNA gyrase subunit A
MAKKPTPPAIDPTLNPEEIEISETTVNDIAAVRFSEFLVASNERAIPDIRDGLIHVDRRILLGFKDNGASATSRHFKSVKIVGDVLGRYHPHGDGAVYGAAVGLAQHWKTRYPLIDFQGNLGSIDGDSAAAYRYTEMRTSFVGDEMLRDLENRSASTVDWGGNFTNEYDEPYVLPARLPLLLANGHNGIGTGFASRWLPHNLREVIDAITAVIDNPKLKTEKVGDYIKGPDFPTGGTVMGLDGFRQALVSGGSDADDKGAKPAAVVVRAKVAVEEDGRETRLVVTEIPWQVQKEDLVAKIIACTDKDEKGNVRIAEISDVADQSGQDWQTDMRLVITLKRDANPALVLAKLYQYTQLQTSFSYAMFAYVDGYPERLNFKTAIDHFIAHQLDVLTRRTQYRRRKALEALEVQEAYLLADKHSNELVPLAKGSKDRAELEGKIPGLIPTATPRQCEVIAGMPLYRFSKIDTGAVRDRIAELRTEIAEYDRLLASDTAMRGLLKDELRDMRTKHGDERRTILSNEAASSAVELKSIDEMLPDEPCWITLSYAGLVGRLPANAFKVQKRGGAGVATAKSEEDPIGQALTASTRSRLLLVTDKGNLFALRASEIDQIARGGRGTNVRRFFTGMAADERVVRIVLPPVEPAADACLVLVTAAGKAKRTALAEYAKITSGGLRTLNLADGDRVVGAFIAGEGAEIIMTSSDGYSVRFPISEVSLQGRVAGGVAGMKLAAKATVVAADPVAPGDKRDYLVVASTGRGKRTRLTEYPTKGRAIRGITTAMLGSASVAFAGPVGEGDTVLLLSSSGKAVAMEAVEIRRAGRATAGVACVALGSGETVSAGAAAAPRD